MGDIWLPGRAAFAAALIWAAALVFAELARWVRPRRAPRAAPRGAPRAALRGPRSRPRARPASAGCELARRRAPARARKAAAPPRKRPPPPRPRRCASRASSTCWARACCLPTCRAASSRPSRASGACRCARRRWRRFPALRPRAGAQGVRGGGGVRARAQRRGGKEAGGAQAKGQAAPALRAPSPPTSTPTRRQEQRTRPRARARR